MGTSQSQGGQTDRHTVSDQTGVDCGKMSSPVVVNAFTSMISVNGKEDMMTELFPSNILTDLDLACSSASFSPLLTISSPGEGLRVRSLCLEDYDRGFLELLGQLTSVGNISREEWEARFQAMKSCKDTYYVVVIEDVNLARVIGAATLVVGKKFIHSCGLVGRLEDVVVSDVYRGKQLGKLVVATTSLLATKLGMLTTCVSEFRANQGSPRLEALCCYIQRHLFYIV